MMSTGGVEDIRAVASKFKRDDMLELLRNSGRKVKGNLVQCPFEGCRDRGPGQLDLRVHDVSGRAMAFCHSCRKSGDYIEVYRAVHGVDLATALEKLRDYAPTVSKPQLRVVRAPVLTESTDKVSTDTVRKVWNDLCAGADELGEQYLESRRLHEAVTAGWVRFATESSASTELRRKAKNGHRVGLLLSDLAGRPLGAQFRTVLPNVDQGDRLRSLTGGHTKGVYFGRPGDVVGSAVVVVTEGIADTLTALLWLKNEHGTAVVGVPGAGQVAYLADALEDAGIDVSGRLFVLLAQHDRSSRGNTSLSAFMQLKTKLQQRGADVVMEVEPPGEAKDWAEAWQKQQLPAWPPTQVARLLGGNSAAGETGMARAQGAAIWHSEELVDPGHLGRDRTSLTWLLSSDTTRVAVCGPGEWRLNEMTDEVEYAGAPLVHDDYAEIQLNLETFKGSMDNKRLKFADTDIRAVVRTLARRKRYSPVREYLERLTGGSTAAPLITEGLAQALSLDAATQGLEVEYLKRWLVAAVARAFEPGCQVDTMLVLQGLEGQSKSRFFEALGGSWFVRMSGDLGSTNAIETMRRAWIIELDEMDAVKRTKEFSTVKAFVTRPTDHYVPKWIRESVEVKRCSVLGGTVNDEEFLVDEDGLRRFWVIALGKKRIDLEWVKANRDGLFAEAVALYRAKQPWHLEPELEELRTQANRRFVIEDPWAPAVRKYLEDHRFEDFFKPDLILGDGFKMQPKEIDLASKKRVGRILKSMGFVAETRAEGRDRPRGWARPKEETL
jgi:predicted P-loop ATPase/phage/plasmid primase-like uncharacterized protein